MSSPTHVPHRCVRYARMSFRPAPALPRPGSPPRAARETAALNTVPPPTRTCAPRDGSPDGSQSGAPSAGLRDLLDRFRPRTFARDDVVIHNTRHEPGDRGGTLAYVVEGLVRGAWNAPFIAPENRATTLVAGDGRWIGADAFKYGRNLFRYVALTDTTAAIVPLAWLRDEAPRDLLVDALRCVSLDWCTSASILGLGSDTLERRAMLLLYNLFRLHPRPEIEVRQRDLAELLGVTRQTLQPVLKRIQRAGLIDLGYGEIVVGDAEALLAELQAPRGTPRPRA